MTHGKSRVLARFNEYRCSSTSMGLHQSLACLVSTACVSLSHHPKVEKLSQTIVRGELSIIKFYVKGDSF